MFKRITLRLYPNRQQAILLNKNFGCCRFIYNYFLTKRKDYYSRTGKNANYFFMAEKLTQLKRESKYEWLKEVDAVSLQQELKHLETAYANFFKHGKDFPKFKSKYARQRFTVVSTEQLNRCRVNITGKYLRCNKHGWIKYRGSDSLLEGKRIRQITISRSASGKYYASCLIEVEEQHVNHDYEACGIDLGVAKPAVIVWKSDKQVKTKIAGLKLKKRLKKRHQQRVWQQRKLARKVKGSNRYKKQRVQVAKAYEREANTRKDYAEKLSNRLTNMFETVVFEDLNLAGMTKSAKGTVEQPGRNVARKRGLNRELLNMAHRQLVLRTEQKAQEKGGRVIHIDPRYTSQTCHKCGCVSRDNRISQAEFECFDCGHADNADRNAALNILRKGLAA